MNLLSMICKKHMNLILIIMIKKNRLNIMKYTIIYNKSYTPHSCILFFFWGLPLSHKYPFFKTNFQNVFLVDDRISKKFI